MKILERMTVVIMCLIVGLLFFSGLMLLTSMGKPNEGSHTGYVTSVEKSGLIFRTNTAYFKSDTSSSQEDIYCASNDVLSQLKEAQTSKKLVTIEYRRGFFMFPWQCSSNTETRIIGVK